MASFGDRLAIIITADGKGAVREIKSVGDAADKNIGKATNRLDKFGDSALRTGAVMVGASVAIGYALSKTVKSAQEAELAQLKLENSVKGSARVSGNAVAAFNAQATALQNVTVASDEAVTGIQAILVQFGLSEKQVLSLTPLVVDLSRKMGIDFDAAAKAVGKSLDGNAGALKRMGINVDATRFATDRLGAVMDALRQKVGGFAKSEGKTFDGQMAILANRMDEFKESIGAGVVGALNTVLPAVNKVGAAIGGVDTATGGMIGKFTTFAVVGGVVAGSMLLLTGSVIKSRLAMEALAASAPRTAAAIGLVGKASIGIGVAVALFAGFSAVINSFSESTDKALGRLQNFGGKGAASLDAFRSAIAGANNGLIDGVKSLLSFRNATEEINFRGLETFKTLADEDAAAARNLLTNLKANRGEHEISEATLKKMSTVLGENAKGQAALGVAAEEAARLVSIETDSLDSQAVALQKTVTAQWAVIDAKRAAAGAGLDLVSATLAQTAAQIAFNKEASPENYVALARANMAVEASVKGVATAAADAAVAALPKFATETDKAAAATNAQRTALEALKVTTPTLTPIIDAYLTALKPVEGVRTTTIKVVVDEGSLASAKWRLTGLPSIFTPEVRPVLIWGSAGGSDNNPFTPRANGGPVSKMQPYIVGERGPELFMPQSNGQIIPNRSLTSNGVGVGGGSSIVVNVSVASGGDPAEVGRKTVDAIKAYERRSGNFWRSN